MTLRAICFMILLCAVMSHAEPKTHQKPPSSTTWMSYLDPSYWMSGRKTRPFDQKRLQFQLLRRRLEYNRRAEQQHRRRDQRPVNRRLQLEPSSRRIEDFFYDYYDNNLDSTLRPPARPTPNCVCRCDCCDCCPCGEDEEFTYIDTWAKEILDPLFEKKSPKEALVFLARAKARSKEYLPF